MKNLILIASFLLLTSCAKSSYREIASVEVESKVFDLYNLEKSLQVKSDKLYGLERIHVHRNNDSRYTAHERKKNKLKDEIVFLEKEIIKQKEILTSLNESSERPTYSYVDAGENDYFYKKSIEVRDLEKYKVTRNFNGRNIYIPYHAYKKIELTFVQKEAHSESGRYMPSDIQCEGSYKFKSMFVKKSYKAKVKKNFKWYSRAKNQGQRVRLYLNKSSGICRVNFKNKKNGKKYAINIFPELKKTDNNSVQNTFQFCTIPKVGKREKLSKHFFTSDFNSMSCPQEVQSIRTLEDSLDGLNSKALALLGSNLPEEMIKNQDPFYPLDFSKAPKLDRILVSYLVFRYDFYGATLLRLLKYHAERGVEIKIMVSKVISLDKDIKQLKDFEEKYDSTKVHFYKFSGKAYGFKEHLSKLHRTLHIKMLLTQSKNDPSRDSVVIGGRNIHDGFVFKTKPDVSKYPDLVQYGKDETFARWTDFEIEIKDPEFVETMAGHYYTLFDYDHKSYLARSFNLNLESDLDLKENFVKESSGPIVRHLMSFPYKDRRALEKYYVKLIDSAKSEIKLSTPYFNLTKKLFSAFSRAIKRGVKIEVITRLDLEGDTADIILSDVNKRAVNSFYKNVKVFEYTNPSDILHSKLFLVDGKITTVGSVNFNQRSFIHDIENTLIIWDEGFYERIEDILESYKKLSRPITSKQKTKLWKSVIIKAFEEEL